VKVAEHIRFKAAYAEGVCELILELLLHYPVLSPHCRTLWSLCDTLRELNGEVLR
jgi:hypothetical protein